MIKIHKDHRRSSFIPQQPAIMPIFHHLLFTYRAPVPPLLYLNLLPLPIIHYSPLTHHLTSYFLSIIILCVYSRIMIVYNSSQVYMFISFTLA